MLEKYFLTTSVFGRFARAQYYLALATGQKSPIWAHATKNDIAARAVEAHLAGGEQCFDLDPRIVEMLRSIPTDRAGEITHPYPAFWIEYPEPLGKDPAVKGLLSVSASVFEDADFDDFGKRGPTRGEVDRISFSFGYSRTVHSAAASRGFGPDVVLNSHYGKSYGDGHFCVVVFHPKDLSDIEQTILLNPHAWGDELMREALHAQCLLLLQTSLWLDSDQGRDQDLIAQCKVSRLREAAQRAKRRDQEVQLDHFTPTITRLGARLGERLSAFVGGEMRGEGETARKAHWVRAHWHRYLVGKGRTQTRRRLVLPFLRGEGEYSPRVYR